MAYVVKSGIVKAYSINSAGEEQVVTLKIANDLFPAPWIFGKSSVALYYYETFSNCELLALQRETLIDFLHTPDRTAATIDYLATNYVSMLVRTTALEQPKATDKIMFMLYYLLFRYGKEIKPGIFTINLPLTHGVIANMVGLTRETTTTELNKLKKLKIVRYNQQSYTIHKKNLEHFLDEDSFKTVRL